MRSVRGILSLHKKKSVEEGGTTLFYTVELLN